MFGGSGLGNPRDRSTAGERPRRRGGPLGPTLQSARGRAAPPPSLRGRQRKGGRGLGWAEWRARWSGSRTGPVGLKRSGLAPGCIAPQMRLHAFQGWTLPGQMGRFKPMRAAARAHMCVYGWPAGQGNLVMVIEHGNGFYFGSLLPRLQDFDVALHAVQTCQAPHGIARQRATLHQISHLLREHRTAHTCLLSTPRTKQQMAEGEQGRQYQAVGRVTHRDNQ